MIATIVLAAGNSSRLGQNKQLLQHEGKSLINRTLDICRKAKCEDIILVVGSDYMTIINQVETEDLTLLYNQKWKNGMSSSITTGTLWAKATKKQGILVVLPDQIHLESNLLMNVARKAGLHPGKLICSRYTHGFGAPSYFPSEFFDELLMNRAGNGAKSILDKHAMDRLYVEFPKGMIDVDRPQDLNLLKS